MPENKSLTEAISQIENDPSKLLGLKIGPHNVQVGQYIPKSGSFTSQYLQSYLQTNTNKPRSDIRSPTHLPQRIPRQVLHHRHSGPRRALPVILPSRPNPTLDPVRPQAKHRRLGLSNAEDHRPFHRRLPRPHAASRQWSASLCLPAL